jgi:hypothetical protein
MLGEMGIYFNCANHAAGFAAFPGEGNKLFHWFGRALCGVAMFSLSAGCNGSGNSFRAIRIAEKWQLHKVK